MNTSNGSKKRRACWAVSLWTVGVLVSCGAWGAAQDAVSAMIRDAGNAATDRARLAYLRELSTQPMVDDALAADAATLVQHIVRWMEDPDLAYFSKEVIETGSYDFGVAVDSPLYPIAQLYLARMLTWVTLEYGGYWSDPEARRRQFDKIRPIFEEVAHAYPTNPTVRMYLGQPIPAPKQYTSVAEAPAWATYQREALERLTDIIAWWIHDRMRADGEYGGGWGDDCEMWRWWTPVLIGFDDPILTKAQARFSKALLSQDHMQGGYTSRVYDVEHTAEDSSDALTPMMHLEPESGEWQTRALRLADLMENLWTGRNSRGRLQFKSTYFSATTVDDSVAHACDTVYHPRAVAPALLAWQRTGDARLGKLFSAWMDTWVEATASSERGKPAGIVPSALHWPDGGIGGVGAHWWDPENHTKDPLYVWPSAMPMMTNTLLLTYYMTQDEKYLAPLRSMAATRLRYIDQPPEASPAPGSEAWCASKLGGLTAVLAKYRLLTGNPEFDALLERDASPYVAFRLSGDQAALDNALADTTTALRINFEGYTSEVRYTDRVLRFPAVLGNNGMFPEGVAGVRSPDTALLYASVTGDPGDAIYFPINAVRWLTEPRRIAALVLDSGRDRFLAELFHFGPGKRSMGAELYLLAPGRYRLALTSGEETIAEQPVEVSGPRTRIAFELPPARTVVLRVEREN